MFKYAYIKIKSDIKLFIYQLIFIFIGLVFVFVLFNIQEASKNKIMSEIRFYDQSVFTMIGAVTNDFPDGFYPSKDELLTAKNQIPGITYFKSTYEFADTYQSIHIMSATNMFIETGVPVSSIKYHYNYISEKIELLYGSVWSESSRERVTVVDADTAMIEFGYLNVVGNEITMFDYEFTIIGVVSNTSDRSEQINEFKNNGTIYDEALVSTSAYIPLGTYEDIYGDIGHYDYITTNLSSTDHVLDKLKSIFNIGSHSEFLLQTHTYVLNQMILDNQIYFWIITLMTSIFALLGVINIANITSYAYLTDKRKLGVYKLLGATNLKLLKLNLAESLVMSLSTISFAILFSYVILGIISLTNGVFMYINWLASLYFAIFLFLIAFTLILMINIVISLLHFNKKSTYFLLGERS